MTTDKTPDIRAESPAARAAIIGTSASVQLPAVVPQMPNGPAPRRRFRRFVLPLVLLIAAAAAGYWWLHSGSGLPPGIAWGNGRLEADEIDIDTKFAGRVLKLFADEGDLVRAGQIVAVMDTKDLQATLKKDTALVQQARRALDEAKANLAQQQTQVKFTQQELDRTSALVPRGYATVELLDQQNSAEKCRCCRGKRRKRKGR